MAFIFAAPFPQTFSLCSSYYSFILPSTPSHSSRLPYPFPSSPLLLQKYHNFTPSILRTTMNHENTNSTRTTTATTNTSNTSSTTSSPPSQTPSISSKQLFAEYGIAYVVLSVAVAVISVFGWYLAVDAGVDVHQLALNTADWLDAHNLSRPAGLDHLAQVTATTQAIGTTDEAAAAAQDQVNALQSWIGPEKATKLVIACLAHELTGPIRLPLYIAALPTVRKWIKKVTNKE